MGKPQVNTPAPFPLSLEHLLVGDISRLRYIRRYGTSLVMHPENVAEHSFYVLFYCHTLARYAGWTGAKVDMEALFTKALVHDMDEALTGDFQRPFKYSDEEMRTLINRQAGFGFRDMMLKIYGSPNIAVSMTESWESAKDDTLEGVIVELADYLSVVSYLWQENRSTSKTMAVHYKTMRKFVKHFRSTRFDIFRAIINDAEKVMKKMKGKKR